MHGYVLTDKQLGYHDLKKPGRVEIETAEGGGVRCCVSGFEFEGDTSCREHAVKAMAWARDVLDAAIKADTLVPGGDIVCVVD